jgi:predicted transcriptional regulator
MEKKKGSPKGQRKGRYSHRIEIDGEFAGESDALLLPKNHLRQGKIYNDFCILNQEFLRYVMSVKLSTQEYRILMFLLAHMDVKNRIIIDAEMIEYNLKINATNVNKYIKKLEKYKIIYKRNLGYRKGAEVQLNFDVIDPNPVVNFDLISPHMAFKDKGNFDNVSNHKSMMRKDQPYIKQHNIHGDIDYINPSTGEIFHVQRLTDQTKWKK